MSGGVPTTGGDGRKWLRTGECCNCGDCCRAGEDGTEDPFGGTRGPAVVPGFCPLFRRLPDGRGVCADYSPSNHYWQIACSGWPWEPVHIEPYPRCTFGFEPAG